MWELDHKEGWGPNNWCFWTVVLENTLERLWAARNSNQFVLKEINPKYSLEGLMLKLKLQSFGRLMRTADSIEETLMLRKIEGQGEEGGRGWGGLIASWLNGHEFQQTSEIVKDSEVYCAAVHGVGKSWVISDWITTTCWNITADERPLEGNNMTRDMLPSEQNSIKIISKEVIELDQKPGVQADTWYMCGLIEDWHLMMSTSQSSEILNVWCFMAKGTRVVVN